MLAPWIVTVMVCTVAIPSFLAAAPKRVGMGSRVGATPWLGEGEEGMAKKQPVRERRDLETRGVEGEMEARAE